MGSILTKRVQNSLLGILLVRFCPHFKIQTFFLAFFAHRMQEIEKYIKNCGLLFVDFLLILYHKVKNYCCLPKKHSLATIEAMRTNVSALKSQFGNLFWTLFHLSDQCAAWGLSCRVKIVLRSITEKLLVRSISNFDRSFYSRVLMKSKRRGFQQQN